MLVGVECICGLGKISMNVYTQRMLMIVFISLLSVCLEVSLFLCALELKDFTLDRRMFVILVSILEYNEEWFVKRYVNKELIK